MNFIPMSQQKITIGDNGLGVDICLRHDPLHPSICDRPYPYALGNNGASF